MNRIVKKSLKKIIFGLNVGKIFMLHHVTKEGLICSCAIEKNNFYNFIENHKNEFISAECMLSLKGKKIKNKSMLTFDDGLWDLYKIAYPYLIENKIPFTIFIITDLLDKNGYITTEQLLEMSKNPLVTVGCHGMKHDILKNQSDEILKREIKMSKSKLESIISKPVELFAYSHGQYDRKTLQYMKLSGYKYAFTVAQLPFGVFSKIRKFELPRYTVDDDFILQKKY